MNARDKNFTRGKVKTRLAHLNETIARYLTALDAADRQEGKAWGVEAGSKRLHQKLVQMKAQMQKLKALEAAADAAPEKQVSLTDPDTRLMVIGDRLTGVVGYNVQTAVDVDSCRKWRRRKKEALGFDRIEALAGLWRDNLLRSAWTTCQ